MPIRRGKAVDSRSEQVTPYQSLRNALQRRGGAATAFEVRRELVALMESYRRPHKPLGEGDLLVIETTGKMKMMTRSEYSDLVHKRKTKRSKDKDGAAMLHYDAHEGEVQVRFDGRAIGTMDGGITDADVDWILDQQEGDQYHGEF
jgi:hypothetical protein